MELILQDLRKSYGKKQVLAGGSFRFEQGKIYGLLGRNGAGKTTLFNCLSREIQADSGSIKLMDRTSVRDLKEDDVGYVYSLPILPEFLTGYEFIRFFIDVNENVIARRGEDVDGLFDMMRIAKDDRHKLLKHYSQGMKNKIQMLLFLLMKPPVILLDEPLTSFDVIIALEMKQLLREMKSDHILIFSTHILQLAADLCDELVVLHDGKLSRVSADLLGRPDFEQQVIELFQSDAEGEAGAAGNGMGHCQDGTQKEKSDAERV
ncbi:ABC transporter ATP-binding protein [Paenibacillus lautus]|nr:ABC transporter ATP-binding protein [Cytobacillus firmus]VTR38074.1 ABC-type cobalamin/Fe3+-siderophores transportsystems, ATPase components [Actinobacillus pleuropneumoniae]